MLKVGDDDVWHRLVNLLVAPAFTLEPCRLAADRLSRHDVLAERIAHNKHFLWLQAESLNAESVDFWVGLIADSITALKYGSRPKSSRMALMFP